MLYYSTLIENIHSNLLFQNGHLLHTGDKEMTVTLQLSTFTTHRD